MNLTDLRECVEMLEELASTTSRKKRIAEVERLTDEYIENTGRVPEAALLERMANVILHEELTDNDEHKMSKTITPEMTDEQVAVYSYPIMSDSMYERRALGKHQSAGKRKDKLVFREVPLTQARNMGTDGINYTLPQRRFT